MAVHLVDASPLAAVDPSGAASVPVSRESRLSVSEFSSHAKSLPPHPVQAIQDHRVEREFEQQQVALGKIFGSHMPLRLNMEQHILAQRQRLPGLPNHYVGLETLLGLDEELDVEDVLGDPAASEKRVDLHAEMERQLFGRAL